MVTVVLLKHLLQAIITPLLGMLSNPFALQGSHFCFVSLVVFTLVVSSVFCGSHSIKIPGWPTRSAKLNINDSAKSGDLPVRFFKSSLGSICTTLSDDTLYLIQVN